MIFKNKFYLSYPYYILLLTKLQDGYNIENVLNEQQIRFLKKFNNHPGA